MRKRDDTLPRSASGTSGNREKKILEKEIEKEKKYYKILYIK